MKYKWLLVMACVLMTACNGAKDDPKKGDKANDAKEGDKSAKVDSKASDDDKSADDENPVDAIAAKLKAARDQFMADYKRASAEEKQKMGAKYPTGADYVDEVTKLAEDNPKSDIAAAAYAWLMTEAGQDAAVAENAMNKLFDGFMDSERMKDVAMLLPRQKPSAEVVSRIETLIKDSPHASVRGAATYAKVNLLEQMEMFKGNLDNEAFVKYYGEEAVAFIKDFKVDPKAAEGLYESIVENYSDVEISRGPEMVKLGDMAANALFEIQNLGIGCTAPDIVANDLDGVEFKLSDYRGKVVMLDFWGDW